MNIRIGRERGCIVSLVEYFSSRKDPQSGTAPSQVDHRHEQHSLCRGEERWVEKRVRLILTKGSDVLAKLEATACGADLGDGARLKLVDQPVRWGSVKESVRKRSEDNLLAKENTVFECIFIRTARKFLSNDRFNPLLSLLIEFRITFCCHLNHSICDVDARWRTESTTERRIDCFEAADRTHA